MRLGRNPSSFRPTKSSTEDDDEEEEEEEEENRALMAVTSALFMATLLPPTSMYVDTCSTQRSAARAIKHHNTNVRRTLRDTVCTLTSLLFTSSTAPVLES